MSLRFAVVGSLTALSALGTPQAHAQASGPVCSEALRLSLSKLAIGALALIGMSQVLLADVLDTTSAESNCKDAHSIRYRLGPKLDVDKLYPVIFTPSMSDYDYSMAVASSIEFYLDKSLNWDQILAWSLSVAPAGDAGYDVSFCSPDPKAISYGKTQTSWLENSKLGLKGILDCQKDKSCWEPTGQGPTGRELACLGPWQFYLPLGLPMVSQKIVMLLHYPPYSAMQKSDYLDNATLNRWHRLLETVGVPTKDWTLFTTTVDIFPIAAPGSGEADCFPPTSAKKFFGDMDGGSGYIPTMLNALVLQKTPDQTVPVIIFGKEARAYWKENYPDASTEVLDAGSVTVDRNAPQRKTPYIGANHPIKAVYLDCKASTLEDDLETTVKQDLTTACFAKTMTTIPNADPGTVAAVCKESYFSATPSMEHASQICFTAVIDKSPAPAWTTSQAKEWCNSHNNRPCPLPNYACH